MKKLCVLAVLLAASCVPIEPPPYNPTVVVESGVLTDFTNGRPATDWNLFVNRTISISHSEGCLTEEGWATRLILLGESEGRIVGWLNPTQNSAEHVEYVDDDDLRFDTLTPILSPNGPFATVPDDCVVEYVFSGEIRV